ncbi:dihydrolipoyl dehydrogenase [Salibacterium halotolerans]|uniref:Dihydrolipoyl dehydrogenase n=1 Tax=Salibacterium halotolerans TaxID=1884432 RepID=A0A1I5NQH5_9BACI|nr:dihydrolipoyl dehydrogenase [Salibacterium halotolerans]SFP24069.1 dihydrolipoamide dehydrogenase [Salibacterium halotolerans]
MPEEYDLVIIGAGTGGYTAAVKAAQEGLKTAVVEKDREGGTCLHQGCIPSKSLLKSAEMYTEMQESAQYGISASDVTLEFDKVQDRKDSVVEQLHRGVRNLMNRENIDVYKGTGRILGPSIFSPRAGTVSVEMNNRQENAMLLPKHVMIATGSRPRQLAGIEADGKSILTSDHALHLRELPASLMIVGGGVIGVEFASMMSDFGVDVTMVEYTSRLLPQEDKDISKEVEKTLKDRGVHVYTNSSVQEKKQSDSGRVTLRIEQDGEGLDLTAEKVLLCIGRRANIEDIGIENTDIDTENGLVVTDEKCRTKETHIYAIGDVQKGMQLAHTASREGMNAVNDILTGSCEPLDPARVPRCTYSRPETASIGWTQEQAEERYESVKTPRIPFQAIGRAVVQGHTDGFVKLIVNGANDDLLGVHMFGSGVTELISEASLAMLVDAANTELSETIHPHPSLSEIYGEAALAAENKAIHF